MRRLRIMNAIRTITHPDPVVAARDQAQNWNVTNLDAQNEMIDIVEYLVEKATFHYVEDFSTQILISIQAVMTDAVAVEMQLRWPDRRFDFIEVGEGFLVKQN